MTDIISDAEIESAKAVGLKLLVTLGNPGGEYAETRHNTGFQVAGCLFQKVGWRKSAWQPENGDLFDLEIPGHEVKLLKPMTFMNSSGDAVVRVTGHFGISPSEVLVISDCLDLPLGRLRMRPGGSCGGQNGVRSILARLGTEAVPRLRVGIGRPQDRECGIIDYVLAPWTSVEREMLLQILPKAADMAVKAVTEGLEAAMNESNSWLADKINAEKQ